MPNEELGAMAEPIETQEATDPGTVEQGAVEEPTEQPEIAEPEVSEDAPDEPNESELENEEVGDIPQGKRSRDSAFAEMRRAREEAEARAEELQSQIAEFQRREREAELIKAAEEMGMTDDEIAQVLAEAEAEEERQAEQDRLTDENERLNQELMDIRITQEMEKDLQAIQKLDPSVKSLDELPDDFFTFKSAGLSGEDAYLAMKYKQEKTGFGAAPVIGKANPASVQRDYYTSEELDAMTPEEILANMDKVNRSLERL